jgi:mRNA interferase MazF
MTRIDPDANNGLTKPSAADGFQIRSISLSRFEGRIGAVSEETVDSIAESVALVIGYLS